MGNSTSNTFITSAPRKIFWRRQEEDKAQLEELLANSDEDFWIIKVKQRASAKKPRLPRSVECVNLAAQKGDAGFQRLNPGFFGEEGP